MLTGTATPDAPSGETLSAHIPEPLDEESRRAKYDLPLMEKMTQWGIACSLRGFSLPASSGKKPGVGIEMEFTTPNGCAVAVQVLADLGAPPETVVEIETDKASIELTLAEAAEH